MFQIGVRIEVWVWGFGIQIPGFSRSTFASTALRIGFGDVLLEGFSHLRKDK